MDKPTEAARSLKTNTPVRGTTMTVGGLNFSCPKCNNPLFFTFKLADEGDATSRDVHCPGCRTVWVIGLDIHPRK